MKKIFTLLARVFVKNVRLGFATNSSSSHSLVYYDEETLAQISEHEAEGLDFGWNHFVAKNLQTKLAYGILSMHRYNWQLEDEQVVKLRREVFEPILTDLGHDPEPILTKIEEAEFPHVDHQSTMSAATPEQMKQNLVELSAENLVVHGGNDNGGLGPEDFIGGKGVLKVSSADSPGYFITPEFEGDENNEFTFHVWTGDESLDLIEVASALRSLPENVEPKVVTGGYQEPFTTLAHGRVEVLRYAIEHPQDDRYFPAEGVIRAATIEDITHLLPAELIAEALGFVAGEDLPDDELLEEEMFE